MVPLVASEKKVEACVVSMLREKVYDDWNPRPRVVRRRTSNRNALYQESPSLVFSSMVVKAGFGRGAPAAKNCVPSSRSTGVGTLTSPLRSR